MQAKQKIAAIYNRNIPQVDGYVTDPSSAATSVNPSPETSMRHPDHQPGFYDQIITDYFDFLDRVDFMPHISPASSQSWDYSYTHCDDDLAYIFEQPDFSSSFLPARRHSL